MTSETSAVLVAVRVRPFQPNEDAATCAVSVPNDKTINITDVWPVLLANTVNVPSHSYTSPLNKHNNMSSSNYVNDVSHNMSGTETSLHNLSNYPITPTIDNNMNSLDNSIYSNVPLTRKDDPYSSANTSQFTNTDTLSCMSASVQNTLNNSNYSTCNSVVNYSNGMNNSNNSALASAQHSFSFDKVFWSVQSRLLPLSLVAEPFHQLCLPEHNAATTTTTSSAIVGFGGGALGSTNVNSGNSNNTFNVVNDDLPSMSMLSRRTSMKSGIITSVHGANSVNDKNENVASSFHTCMSSNNNNNNIVTIKLPAQLPCFCATPAFDSQKRVYDFIGPKMYHAAFSGFNTCLFAYGQTGSGKTYSMIGPPEKLLPSYGKNNSNNNKRRMSLFGRFRKKQSILVSSSPKCNKNDTSITFDSAKDYNNKDEYDDDDENEEDDDEDDAGIMPRLCSDLFEIMRKERETDPGVSFTVEMSFMEIYCEKVRDLLAPNLSSASSNPSLRIRQHPVRGPYVEGLSRYSVKSAAAVLKHLLRGLKERATAETKMNEHSSRSHAIMQLFITKVTVTTVATMSADSNNSNVETAPTKNSKRVSAQKMSKNEAKKRIKRQANKESVSPYSNSSVGSPCEQKSEQQIKGNDVDNVFQERMNTEINESNNNSNNIHCDGNNLIFTNNNSSATVSSKVSRKEEEELSEYEQSGEDEEKNEDDEDEEGERIADRLNEGEVVTKTRRSKVSMVDLAGSERVSQSGVTGERFEETKNINLSLSSLGRIIQQLSEKQSGKHVIPAYRESNLTWLLSDSLGGNSKTIMLATVAPNAYCYQQTLNTLRFAGVTKKIINVATVNEDSHFQQLIADLRQQIVRLTLQIENSKHISMHEAEVMQLSAECELLRQQNGALRVQLSTMPDSSTVLTLQDRIASLHRENASLRADVASLEHELLTSNSTHRAQIACKDAELTRLREQQSHIVVDHNARSETTSVLPNGIVSTTTSSSVKNASTASDKNNTKVEMEKGNEKINMQLDNTSNINNESIENTDASNKVMVAAPINVTTNGNKATEVTGQNTSAASMIAAHANQNIHEFTLVHTLRSQIEQLTREVRGYKRRCDEANEVISNQERELKEVKLRQREVDEQYNTINTSLRVKVIELERCESELAILREEHAAMQRQHEVELEWYESRITEKNSKDNDTIAEQMHQVRNELDRVQQAYWDEKHSSANLLLRVTELEKEKQEMRIIAHNKQNEIDTLERYLFEETEMSERYYQQMRYERQLMSMLHETQRHLQHLHHYNINNEIRNPPNTKLEQVCIKSQSDRHRYKQSNTCIINNNNSNDNINVNNGSSTRVFHNSHPLPSVSSSMSLSSISMPESLTTLSPITSNRPTSVQSTLYQEQITSNYHHDDDDNHMVDTSNIINSPNRNNVDAIKLQSTLMREDVLFRTLGITYAQLEYECVSEEIRHRLMIEQECQHSIEQLQTTQLQGYKVIAMNLTIACNDAHDMINELNDKLHCLQEQLRESEMTLSESQKAHAQQWELHRTKSEVERARMQRELQHLFEERIANKQREIDLLTMELEEWEDRYKELQVRCQHAETRILELEEELSFSTHTTQSADELANKQDANTTAAVFTKRKEKTPTTSTETEIKHGQNLNAEEHESSMHQDNVVADAKPVDEENTITTTQENYDHVAHIRHVAEAHVQELRNAYTERDILQAECNALQSEIIALRSKVDEKHNKLIEVESELDTERESKALHVQALQSRLDILQQKYDKATEASERQMNELLELVKVQRVSLKEESKETDAARSDRDKALRELYQVREELEKTIDECNQLKEQNGEHSKQLTMVRNEISSLKLSYKQLENELHRLTHERGPDMYLLVDRTGTSEEDELREQECFTKAREERVKLEEQRRMAHKLNEELKRHILRQTSQLRDVERLLEDKHEEHEEQEEEHKGVNLVDDTEIDLPVK